jgi:hypothetical protein
MNLHKDPTDGEAGELHEEEGEEEIEVVDVEDNPPDICIIVDWMEEGGCEATDGCWVEPDGYCEHGKPSWAIVLGYI